MRQVQPKLSELLAQVFPLDPHAHFQELNPSGQGEVNG